MSNILNIGLSGLAGAARSYAAQRPEKRRGLGQALGVGLAAAQLGGMIGKDISISKGLPKEDPRTGGEVLGARDAAQAAAEQKMSGASQEGWEKKGAIAGGIYGLISALAD